MNTAVKGHEKADAKGGQCLAWRRLEVAFGRWYLERVCLKGGDED